MKAGYDMWPEQVLENIKAVRNTTFSEDELEKIDVIFRWNISHNRGDQKGKPCSERKTVVILPESWYFIFKE